MIDLASFATQEKADEGVWFPVRLYGKQVPLAILVYGDDSDVVAQYNREKIRKMKVGKNGAAELDSETIDELLDSADDNVVIRIGGISAYDLKKKENTDEPVVLFGKTLGNDKKSYRLLIEKIPAIKQFVLEKSGERTNFLSGRKAD